MRHRQRRRRGPAQVTAKLTIPFVGEISGTWEPADAERSAAWELYLELVTRVSVEELDPEEGFLREALSSLYTFFTTTREILRRYGPDVAPPLAPGHMSFGVLAVTVLNRVLRPLLASWHPRLAAYESQRPEGHDPVSWEREWEHAESLRLQIGAVRQTLVSLARTLQEVADVSDLIDLPTPRSPGLGHPPPQARGTVNADHRAVPHRSPLTCCFAALSVARVINELVTQCNDGGDCNDARRGASVGRQHARARRTGGRRLRPATTHPRLRRRPSSPRLDRRDGAATAR